MDNPAQARSQHFLPSRSLDNGQGSRSHLQEAHHSATDTTDEIKGNTGHVGDLGRDNKTKHDPVEATVRRSSPSHVPPRGSTKPLGVITEDSSTKPANNPITSGQDLRPPRPAVPNSSRRRFAGRTNPARHRERDSSPYRTDSEASEDEGSIHYFVPGEKIEKDVLETYMMRFIDARARVVAARLPSDHNRQGYNCSSQTSLKATDLRLIAADVEDWKTERLSEAFLSAPYSYLESDTWRKRRTTVPPRATLR